MYTMCNINKTEMVTLRPPRPPPPLLVEPIQLGPKQTSSTRSIGSTKYWALRRKR